MTLPSLPHRAALVLCAAVLLPRCAMDGGDLDSAANIDEPVVYADGTIVFQRSITLSIDQGQPHGTVGEERTVSVDTLYRFVDDGAGVTSYVLHQYQRQERLVAYDVYDHIEDWATLAEETTDTDYASCVAWREIGKSVPNAWSRPYDTADTRVACWNPDGGAEPFTVVLDHREQPTSYQLPADLPTMHALEIYPGFSSVKCLEDESADPTSGVLTFVLEEGSCASAGSEATDLCGYLAHSSTTSARTRLETSDLWHRSSTYGYYFFADQEDRTHHGNYASCEVSASADLSETTISCAAETTLLDAYSATFPTELCEFRIHNNHRLGFGDDAMALVPQDAQAL